MSSNIKEWLDQNGLGEHAEAFIANEIDLDAARDLTENDLRELGIAMGPRKKQRQAAPKNAPPQTAMGFSRARRFASIRLSSDRESSPSPKQP